MSVRGANLVIGDNDVKFFRGLMYGFRQDGTLSNVPFGELQEVDMTDTASFKELRGPGSRVAVAVAMSERKISGSAKYAKLRASALAMLRGGTVAIGATGSVDEGKTIYTAFVNDAPIPFILHIADPLNGEDDELILYGCLAPDLKIPMKLDDFVIEEFSFMAYGDQTTGILYERKYPGNQLADPALPTGFPPLPTTGTGASLRIIGLPSSETQAGNVLTPPAPAT